MEFGWSEEEFLTRTEGSAIRRTGYQGWLRNIAVALGNAEPATAAARSALIDALQRRREESTELVREHIDWALDRLQRA